MTERLYYTDAYLTTFSAAVTQVRAAQERTLIALDRSAFYPTSGGQPHDTGRLAGARVVEVSADDGVVWHALEDAPPLTIGQTVDGEIDWPRRYDHMQQHAGQHLLSQVFDRLYGYATVSVHFGPTESTLDLDTPLLDAAQIDAAEQLAHAQIYAALPIRAYFVDEAQMATLALRRPPKVTGRIRIVEIADYDYSACGGAHTRTTAEIGPVKIIRSERRRGQVRLTFLCGGRAVADYAHKHALLQEAATLFNSDVAQVPALAARAHTQAKEAQRRVDELTERLMTFEARTLLAATSTTNGLRVVTVLRDDIDAATLRTLAGALVAEAEATAPNFVALLASNCDGKLLLAFARSTVGGTIAVTVVAPAADAQAAQVPVAVDPAQDAAVQTLYPFGTRLRFTALPAAGYRFTGWSGSLSGAKNPQEVTLTAPLDVRAVFAPLPVYLPAVAR